VEGWRAEFLSRWRRGADGRIVRCHNHDPSWQNWPVLEHAVLGNIASASRCSGILLMALWIRWYLEKQRASCATCRETWRAQTEVERFGWIPLADGGILLA